MRNHIKVLHAPASVGGNPQGLSRAERKECIDSLSVAVFSSYLKYESDIILQSRYNWITSLRRIYWGFFKIIKFDIIHYNFGSSFMPFRINPFGRFMFLRSILNFFLRRFELLDLKFAKFIGKKVYMTFQGDDVRQGDFCKTHFKIHFADRVSAKYYPAHTDVWKRERVKVIDRYCDQIFALNPDLLHVLPKRASFLPYSHIDLDEWSFVGTNPETDFVPHVVHAPSNRDVKGTDKVIAAMEKLSCEGIPFRFTLVEGLSNSEAKKIYETADLLIDQLFAGFYGGLAVELMALGKPVICYMRQEDFPGRITDEMINDFPVINSEPDQIYDVLKFWLTSNKDQLNSQGKKSRLFVEKWHHPTMIAKQMMKYYSDSIADYDSKKVL